MGNLASGARDVKASPETVWDLLADVEHWPDTFTPHLRRAHLDGPLQPGVTGWVVLRFPPIRSPFEVTTVQPHRSWEWRGKLLWLTLVFDHRCERSGQGTLVVFDVDLSGSFSSLLRPVIRLRYQPQLERALDLLVEFAEVAE